MNLELTTHSVEETAALAERLAAVVRSGDVILLSGELGSGKTTFVRAFAESLGADLRAVSSPTYVMVNRYPVTRAGLHILTHIDAYRIHGVEELEALGWDQLFDEHSASAAPGSVALIEWPERIADALPQRSACIVLQLHHAGRTERTLALALPDSVTQRSEAASLLKLN